MKYIDNKMLDIEFDFFNDTGLSKKHYDFSGFIQPIQKSEINFFRYLPSDIFEDVDVFDYGKFDFDYFKIYFDNKKKELMARREYNHRYFLNKDHRLIHEIQKFLCFLFLKEKSSIPVLISYLNKINQHLHRIYQKHNYSFETRKQSKNQTNELFFDLVIQKKISKIIDITYSNIITLQEIMEYCKENKRKDCVTFTDEKSDYFFRERLLNMLKNKEDFNQTIFETNNDDIYLNQTTLLPLIAKTIVNDKDNEQAAYITSDKTLYKIIISSYSHLKIDLTHKDSDKNLYFLAMHRKKRKPAITVNQNQIKVKDLKSKCSKEISEIVKISEDFNPKILDNVLEVLDENRYQTLSMQKNHRYFVIGDIHADATSLQLLLKHIYSISKEDKTTIIFLGDYLDRGDDDLEVLNIVFKLKIRHPENVILLKGNHEDYAFEKEDIIPHFLPADFYDFYYETFKENELSEKLFITVFSKLKIFLKLKDLKGHEILLVHGGIPQRYFLEPFSTMEDMVDHSSDLFKKEKIKKDILHSFIWNDPTEVDMKENLKKKRGFFSQKDFEYFMEKYNIKTIIRGHEYDKKNNLPYKFNFGKDGKEIITVFSTGNTSESTGYSHVKGISFLEILGKGELELNYIIK